MQTKNSKRKKKGVTRVGSGAAIRPLGGYTQLHAGRDAMRGHAVWHARNRPAGVETIYWSGNWGERTAEQLFRECQTIMADLLRNHPELAA